MLAHQYTSHWHRFTYAALVKFPWHRQRRRVLFVSTGRWKISTHTQILHSSVSGDGTSRLTGLLTHQFTIHWHREWMRHLDLCLTWSHWNACSSRKGVIHTVTVAEYLFSRSLEISGVLLFLTMESLLRRLVLSVFKKKNFFLGYPETAKYPPHKTCVSYSRHKIVRELAYLGVKMTSLVQKHKIVAYLGVKKLHIPLTDIIS